MYENIKTCMRTIESEKYLEMGWFVGIVLGEKEREREEEREKQRAEENEGGGEKGERASCGEECGDLMISALNL